MIDPETNNVEVARDVKFLSSEFSTEISEDKDDSTECNNVFGTVEIANDKNDDEELQPQQDNSVGPLNQQARRVTRRRNTELDSLDANQIMSSRLRSQNASGMMTL